MSLLEVRDLQKVYTSRGGNRTAALRGVSFAVEEGEFVAVMGESGKIGRASWRERVYEAV